MRNATLANLDHWKDENGRLIAYAWPGGYQVIYIDRGGEILCPDCAQKLLDGYARDLLELFCDWVENGHDGRYCGSLDLASLPQAGDIFYEGAPEFCADCNREIESAYGDPDSEEEEGTDSEEE